MNLYLLKLNDWRGYDITTGFVIAAKNEADARVIARFGCLWEHCEESTAMQWQDEKKSSCQLIGASEPKQDGVIMRQFRHG